MSHPLGSAPATGDLVDGPPPYPTGPRRRNGLGGLGIGLALLALISSGALGAAVVLGVGALGASAAGLRVTRRPKSTAVVGIVLAVLAIVVAVSRR